MKNLRVFFLFIAIYCFFTNNLYAFEYTEDNAAYWYKKAYYELENITKLNNFYKARSIYSIDFLFDYGQPNMMQPMTYIPQRISLCP